VAGCAVLTLAVMGVDHALDGHVHGLLKVAVQIATGTTAYAVSMAFLARQLSSELWSTAKPLFMRSGA
jgi:hypothetical protein